MTKYKCITVSNCRDICKNTLLWFDYKKNDSQSQAWEIVYKFCLQNGMKRKNKDAAIETVIRFIDNKIKKSKKK